MKNEISSDSVIEVLSQHIGKQKGISAQELAEACMQRSVMPGDLRQLRKVIQQLRGDGHHICAHPATGYFIAENAEELDATCEFLYDRAISSLKQISRMKKVAMPDIRGQLRLPT
ncbi:hypothetical protein FHP88_15560 [Sedimenticola selenatireducens]|uniref:Uncharacterized protein n=1 Tax=Sedimenticola selenatireducens TaxID=191960 RepID=A0A557S0B5_9GAMM|nr:hypothetical protein [Sedimenticola selenatireducens]TVO70870.1 hypothetical protein FHP88_15560 [Sedimenticola selenatireducens]